MRNIISGCLVVLSFLTGTITSYAQNKTLKTASPAASNADLQVQKPSLIIMISVDMLSGEIMDRFTDNLPGGLGRLLREGVVFENGYQEHAFTETGPGHSTLLSGRHPSSTGIPNNSWIDMSTGKTEYCVNDISVTNIGQPEGGIGCSPKWFIGTTFGTWLRDQFPGSRVFSIAGKDRAAILMAGPKTNGVYWFQEGFGFTTSTAYAKKLPDWLLQYNKSFLQTITNKSIIWNPIGPADGKAYPGVWHAQISDTIIVSTLPRLVQTQGFPQEAAPGFLFDETQNGSFWSRWRATPFWDEAIFNAAEAMIKNEHIGQGPNTDLLCLGLSATNATEHAYGNAGPEIQDLIRRLDLRLGEFLNKLQKSGRTVAVVLSADHGGLDFAERLRSQGIPARRLNTALWLKDLQARVRTQFNLDKDLLVGSMRGLYLKKDIAAPLGDRRQVLAKVVDIIRTMPEIAAVATYEELAALPEKRFADPRTSSLLYRLKFSAYPGRSGDILFAFNPLVELNGPPKYDPAQHGTPHDYDRRVPIIFWGPWKAEQRYDPASTVDIAPTLAQQFGINPEEKVDGVALKFQKK
ncbi:alkaline phosphatase family protein [Mucilaginibacter celer]|uniref:Alkaline phosphatase family protein n=1 Tax=Mucilaginibacter celer TaxID=2305508 RepID=A0A494VPA1_9SPHI|nr:alkaline phosphatase family protein [Mucilaginibacter celer]AYL94950.1 alkaline phosphatase family protein [Mucilaginibacter celer]